MTTIRDSQSVEFNSRGLAASIGLINSVGNLGGFVGPFIVGYLLTRTHSFNAGLLFLVGSFLISAMLMLSVRVRSHNSAT